MYFEMLRSCDPVAHNLYILQSWIRTAPQLQEAVTRFPHGEDGAQLGRLTGSEALSNSLASIAPFIKLGVLFKWVSMIPIPDPQFIIVIDNF